MFEPEDPGASYSRHESDGQRLDRNYGELLQELRVAQTGVQILFAFLLGTAFQQRFAQISTAERALYVTTLICAACTSILLTAPVSVHRVLFRQHRKDALVALTGASAAVGLVFLALTMLSGLTFVLAFVVNLKVALGVSIALAVLVIFAWVVFPLLSLRIRRAKSGAVEPHRSVSSRHRDVGVSS